MPPRVLNWIRHLWYFLIHLARITIADQKGIVPLIRGQDVQCYNYSLPYSFARVPEIAIGTKKLTQQYMTLRLSKQTIYSFLSNQPKLRA